MTKFRQAYEGCPLCGAAGLEVRRATASNVRGELPRELVWIRCGSCSHIHTRYFWTDAGRAELFERCYAEQVYGGELDQQRLVWARVINDLSPFVPPTTGRGGRWVDVGSGNGSFVFTAREFGYNAIGLDLRGYAIDKAIAREIPMQKADAATYDYSGAEVVVLADVLEHMPYPAELLTRIRAGIAGPLFISCPNMDCQSWRELDAQGKNFYWQEAEHFHNFTRARLYALLDSCGFTPRRYSVSQRYQACMEIIAT